MQPIGGAKGYALSLMVELLCSGLSGGVPDFEVRVPQDPAPESCRVSHFFLAVNPAGFTAADGVLQGIANVSQALEHACAIDPSQPVRLPGSRGAQNRARNHADGILLDMPLLNALRETQRRLGSDQSNPVK